eukprot:TRINITY_DN112_c0_g1_i6.p1 TRINITY_DN112_c0_g1~~TRINITY_DN112_c0_g1_i6.p1  ORF type:complete len:855 (-),score=208.44 TRINITY_DN112_c0_g1_i6:239-2803(-)
MYKPTSLLALLFIYFTFLFCASALFDSFERSLLNPVELAKKDEVRKLIQSLAELGDQLVPEPDDLDEPVCLQGKDYGAKKLLKVLQELEEVREVEMELQYQASLHKREAESSEEIEQVSNTTTAPRTNGTVTAVPKINGTISLMIEGTAGTAASNEARLVYNFVMGRMKVVNPKFTTEWIEKARPYRERINIVTFNHAGGTLSATARNAVNIAIANQTHVVIGPNSDNIVPLTSAVLSIFDIPQIGFRATNPALADKTDYPNFSRPVPNYSKWGDGMAKLVHHYGWKRVVFLCTNDLRGSTASAAFSKYALEHDIEIMYSKLLDPTVTVTKGSFKDICEAIKQLNVKIIVAPFGASAAVNLFTSAMEVGLIGDDYVWILTEDVLGGPIKFNLYNPTNGYNYSTEILDEWLPGALGIGSKIGAGPLFYESFAPDLLALLKSIGQNYVLNDIPAYVTYFNDALLTVIFAFGDLYEKGIPFDNSKELLKAIRRQSFMGVTGPVSYDENGERVGYLMDILHYVKGRGYFSAGYIENSTHFVFTEDIVWRDGTTNIPPDRAPPQDKFISKGLVIFFFALASLLIVVAIIIMIITSTSKDVIVVQHSGFFFLMTILVGALIMISSVYVMGVDMQFVSRETMDRLCMLQVWMVGYGFVFIFGSLFAKSLRILILTNEPNLSKIQHLEKKMLLLMLAVLLGETIILIVWSVKDPLRVVDKLSSSELDMAYFCESESKGYPLAWIIYKGLFLVGGIILAYMSRNIENRFNESKLIAFSIYNVFLISAVATPICFLIDNQPDVTFAIKSLGVIGISVITTGMLFGGMVYIIFIGKISSSSRSHSASGHSNNSRSGSRSSLEAKY